MEPRHRAAEALSEDPPPEGGSRTALRLVAGCMLLVGLAFIQSPGLMVPDTKFDLAVDPAGFLSRALHLWDPLGSFGQLQNQAYGYLWPMGPFFWVGDLLGAPGWVVQRSWLALVLCTAFVGAALLARRLGVRSDLAILVAGAAYALSPRMLTVLGPISIEAWPSALAPWVLLPLVVGSRRGSPRRAAALSAVAVAMVGGVNAAATFAVIPLGAVWLLTRAPGPRRRSLMVWWPVFVLVGTLWWLVPLFVLGAYSPPFLDFIEAADNTTFSTTMFDALRGTSNWVPYVDVSARAGNDLLRDAQLVALGGIVLVAGLVGLLDRRTPQRDFLAISVVLGMLMLTFGHEGVVQGWYAASANDLLDGALAPLRNVHKLDPVVRLPLVLGLAWSVQHLRSGSDAARATAAAAPSWDARLAVVRAHATTFTVVVAVLACATPAALGRITPTGGTVGVPDYWSQAAAWLEERGDDGVALLLPGSSFATYVWGSPRDEPMQWLAGSRWAVRNAVPLTPPGTIRMLDEVEERMSQGRGTPGLAAYLARAGVAHLVVRNDLERGSGVPDPVLVRQALVQTPGVERVATFGPELGGEAHLDRPGRRVLVNGGWQARYPAVEIWSVGAGRGGAAVAEEVPTVVGGPEDLLDLADLGVLGDGPARLATDEQADRPAQVVLTDGLRAVERNFGRVHDAASATLVPGQTRRLGGTARDYLPEGADRWSTWARVVGAEAVTASSSMSDATAVGGVRPGQLPYAAVDGDDRTFWRADVRAGQEQWWQLGLQTPRSPSGVRVTAGDAAETVTVHTDGQSVGPVRIGAGSTRLVPLDGSSTTTLRVQDASGRGAHRMSLAEVEVPGVEVQRRLRLPELPRRWGAPDAVALRTVSDARRGCALVDGDLRCQADRAVAGEEETSLHRELELSAGAGYRLAMTAQVREGTRLAERVFGTQAVSLRTSSDGVPDPRAGALAAVDGDRATTWSADLADEQPVLRLSWLGQRTLRGIRVTLDEDVAARRPDRLRLVWPGGERRVTLDSTGLARFAPIRTDRLTVTVRSTEDVSSLGFDSVPSDVPVGISELRLLGLPFLPVEVPTEEVRLGCGSGPTLVVDGVRTRSSVRASLAQLTSPTAPDRVPVELCGDDLVTLGAGTTTIDVEPSRTFVPRSLTLVRDGAGLPLGEAGTRLGVEAPSPVERVVEPRGGAGVLALRENANPGWEAARPGSAPGADTVDGWQQAWALRGSAEPVVVRFAPDVTYRAGLLAGLLLLAGLVVGVVLPRRGTRRRAEPPALEERRLASWVMVGAGVAAAAALAGPVGLGVGLATVLVGLPLLRRSPVVFTWAVGLTLAAAAAAYALRPWGDAAGWAGAAAWPGYAVVAVLVALLLRPERAARRPVPPQRIPGSST